MLATTTKSNTSWTTWSTCRSQGFGYSAYFSGSEFLPFDDTGSIGTAVIGATHRARSQSLRKIVEKGAKAVPVLLEHLGDERTIKMEPLTGMMWMSFSDEYDFNSLTRSEAPAGVNRDWSDQQEEDPDTHALTVGDLCFVALGQIVNRNFAATRYQPSGGLIVSSPTYSKRLRDVVLAEWTALTTEKHRESLIADFKHSDDGSRDINAYLRLAFYYPEVVESVVMHELEKPTFEVSIVASFVHETLYPSASDEERKQVYEAFVREHGEPYTIGVMAQLFIDLQSYEFDEQRGVVRNKTDPKWYPRELLPLLFDQPEGVKSTDRPEFKAASVQHRAWLLGPLTHDPSKRIGEVARVMYLEHASDENDFVTSACLRCLANRGFGEFLVERLDRIDLAETKTNWKNLSDLEAINTSKDKLVQDRLNEIVKTTMNDNYFMAAMKGTGPLDDSFVWKRVTEILDQLPDETDQGGEMLRMVHERFPDKAKQTLIEFLAKASVQRAETVCVVLWYGDPMSVEVLAPLLDDEREMEGFCRPTRVCDRAAQAISHCVKWIKFDREWSSDLKREAIAKLKAHCAQSTK